MTIWETVPMTDGEVVLQFEKDYPNDLLREIMMGLYRVKRLRGQPVLDALSGTLEDYVRTMEEPTNDR